MDPGSTAVQGNLYLDGSGSRELVPELNRAAWSVAMCDDQGALIARTSGPVWGTLPQTPRAAEYVAL
eukprot:7384105-Heterocapsa_arctica.AAC.1